MHESSRRYGGGDTGGGNTPSVPEVQGYTVRFAAGEGGAITAKADGQNIVSGSKVKKDTLVTFTATPAGNSYVVGEWTIASPAVFKDGGEKGAMTAEVSVTGDVTIGVQFEQVTPLAPGQIRIMITGDERVDPYKSYIDTAKNTTWGAIKTQIETKLTLKTEWRGGNYGAYAWKLGNENGAALTDGHPFTEGATVYAVTNYIKLRMNGTVLEGYDGAKPRGRIIIPDTVTRIKEEAFKDCTALTGTLVFPRSLKEIEGAVFNGAFQNCIRLTGLDFSACTELTEIGYYAFYNCSGLTGSLDLSACTKLTKIGERAFMNCTGFNGELKLPPNITEIGTYAFSGCRGFTGSLDLSVYTQLTKIGSYAFYDCSGFSGELKLPANITEIGEYAFYECKGLPEAWTCRLTQSSRKSDLSRSRTAAALPENSNCLQTSPKSVQTLFPAVRALREAWTCRLAQSSRKSDSTRSRTAAALPVNSNCLQISPKSAAALFSIVRVLQALWISTYTKLTKIEKHMFYGCSGFTEIKLPANITEIGEYAFYECKGFTGSLDLSACSQLTKIGDFAFRNCSGFTGELKLPVNLTEIGERAFSGCTGFTGSLDLSACSKLTKIESYAFSGCTRAEVKLSQNITKIGSEAFGRAADVLYSDMADSYCKKVKIPNGAQYDRIKALVTGCRYPEDRIESY
nr:leucine-rich repeat protein [Treponema socranskii]